MPEFKINKTMVLNALDNYLKDLAYEIREGISLNESDKNIPLPIPDNYFNRKTKEEEIDNALSEVFHEIDTESIIKNTGRIDKWNPEDGTYLVKYDGSIEKMSPVNKVWWETQREEALSSGRVYKTKEQAEFASSIFRKFRRFIRWVIDQDPDFNETKIVNGFYELLNEEFGIKLKEKIQSGEVEF